MSSLFSSEDFSLCCSQIFPDPMHTLHLGMVKHLLNASLWRIKKYVTEIVDDLIPAYVIHLNAKAHREFLDKETKIRHKHSDAVKALGPARNATIREKKAVLEERLAAALLQCKEQYQEQVKPERNQAETHIRALLDCRAVVSLLEQRISAISIVCRDLGISPYMCREISRTWSNMEKAIFSYNGKMKAHEWFTFGLVMPYVWDGLLDAWWQAAQTITNSDQTLKKLEPKTLLNDITCVWYTYNDYACKLRQSIVSQAEVDQMCDHAVQLQKLILKHLPEKYPNDTRGWNMIKFHWLPTFPASRLLMGSLRGFSCQAVELAHQPYSKAIGKKTNLKHDPNAQMMQNLSDLAAISAIASNQHDCDPLSDDEDDDGADITDGPSVTAKPTGEALIESSVPSTSSQSKGQYKHPIYGCPLRDMFLQPGKVRRELCSYLRRSVPITDFMQCRQPWANAHPCYKELYQRLAEYLWLRYRNVLAIDDETREALSQVICDRILLHVFVSHRLWVVLFVVFALTFTHCTVCCLSTAHTS